MSCMAHGIFPCTNSRREGTAEFSHGTACTPRGSTYHFNVRRVLIFVLNMFDVKVCHGSVLRVRFPVDTCTLNRSEIYRTPKRLLKQVVLATATQHEDGNGHAPLLDHVMMRKSLAGSF
jgi:hypothetical protein